MAVDVFDDDGQPVRGEVGELVCTEAVAGHDARPVPAIPSATSRRTGRAIPTCGGTATSRASSADGQWFLHGRSDDTIKLAGKRLGPAEVETAVVAHPRCVEAAAIGVPDELKGEALWVFVVLAPGVEPSDALRAEITAARRRRARAVVQARRRCGSRARSRRRAAPRCCGARSVRS